MVESDCKISNYVLLRSILAVEHMKISLQEVYST